MGRLALAILILLTANIHAQDPGAAAVQSSSAGTTNNWEKWVFTGSSFAFVAAGIAVLFANGINGSNPITNTSTNTHN